jgi:hypothetical protein
MSSAFIHIFERGDRVVIQASGIVPGMRHTQRILSISTQRRGPSTLEELVTDAALAILRDMENKAG